MSGPVGQGGLTAFSASKAMPACASSASSSSCAPAPFGRSAMRAPPLGDRGDVGELQRIARRDQQALLAPGEGDQHRVVQARARCATASTLALSSSPSIRCRWMAAAITSPRASRREARLRCPPAGSRARSRFRAAPIPAADRGCRRRSAARAGAQRRRGQQAGRHPAVERRLGKQPAAGDLAARHRAVGHELVELALRQPQVGGGFVGGQEVRHPAPICINLQIFRDLTEIGMDARDCSYRSNSATGSMPDRRLRPSARAQRRPGAAGHRRAVARWSAWRRSASPTLIGLPLGAAVALLRFPGREAVIVTLNALMGLPPVVVGLAVYLLLSRSGPLGSWGLLFTPQAMVIAQTDPGDADHRGAGAPDHRGSLGRVSRRARRDECRPGAAASRR